MLKRRDATTTVVPGLAQVITRLRDVHGTPWSMGYQIRLNSDNDDSDFQIFA
jgi:hypothetical protein